MTWGTYYYNSEGMGWGCSRGTDKSVKQTDDLTEDNRKQNTRQALIHQVCDHCHL